MSQATDQAARWKKAFFTVGSLFILVVLIFATLIVNMPSKKEFDEATEKVALLQKEASDLRKDVADATKTNTVLEGANKTLQTSNGELQKLKGKLEGELATATKAKDEMADKLAACQAKKPAKKPTPPRPPKADSKSKAPPPNLEKKAEVAAGIIWYWRENKATLTSPGRCVFSAGNGEGKPPFCATFDIVAPNQGETKTEWIARVSGGGRVRVELDKATYQKQGNP